MPLTATIFLPFAIIFKSPSPVYLIPQPWPSSTPPIIVALFNVNVLVLALYVTDGSPSFPNILFAFSLVTCVFPIHKS